ncbi:MULTISPECIES: sulfite exporter TauE/SafE family protein [unclassified Paracoccus (in: a-proteobacteria)]|uniref:sulfite exporter TauE/SafE family protein n=1 Tax=unclassified Paracoccus (in: a-proteobacteria) TaxID=2688777 RepID=UPI00351C459D
MDLTVGGWLLLALASALVGLAKGGLAMVGMLAVPILSLAMSPVQAAGLLLPVYVVSDAFGLIAYRRHWDRRVVTRLLPGAVAGVALGWATASLVDDAWVGGIVGVIGAWFAVMTLLRPAPEDAAPREPDWLRGTGWGAVTGYTSFVSHSGGPPYQIYVQPLRLGPQTYAGTVTVFFAVVNLVKLVPYAALGQLGAANLGKAATMIPVAAASVFVGVWLVRRIPQRAFYLFITWALLAVSLKLIADAVM